MIATTEKIRQSELMQKHGMKPGEIVEFRDANLSRDVDWWKEGATIYWTPQAAKQLETKGGEPEAIMLRVVRACRNPRFVMADKDGVKIDVRCRPGMAQRLVGKTIPVRVTREGDETIYTHEQ